MLPGCKTPNTGVAAPDSARGARDGGGVRVEGDAISVLGLRPGADGLLSRLPADLLLGLPGAVIR